MRTFSSITLRPGSRLDFTYFNIIFGFAHIASYFLRNALHRSAYESSKEALEVPTIRTVVIIAEGVPENDVRPLID